MKKKKEKRSNDKRRGSLCPQVKLKKKIARRDNKQKDITHKKNRRKKGQKGRATYLVEN